MNLSEASLTTLRGLVKEIDVQLTGMSALASTKPDQADSTELLRSTWAKLIDALDLGPEPELRECPVCHHSGMRAATVCGFCWSKLVPLRPRTDADGPALVGA